MSNLTLNTDYKLWLTELKKQIHISQIKAKISVNTEMILLYWDMGKQILEKQENSKWGSGFIDQLSKDLKTEFPDMKGFSVDNIRFMKRMYLFYSQHDIISAQLVQIFDDVNFEKVHNSSKIEISAQTVQEFENNSIIKLLKFVPWGHHTLILRKISNIQEALFYLKETIENNWSRSVLEMKIETNLYERQGKSVNNFELTLPKPQSELANQLLKDPYNFEFLTLQKQVKETELEKQLINHITQFLLELGKGFAYMGRQYSIKVGQKEYRTDLLFYHIHLRSYIIIELKMKEFEPEFIGKLNFYMSAINELIKTEVDNTTIGILLCKNKDNFEVEFALKDINKPIGVSEFKYKELPENIKKALPEIEQLKTELNKFENEQ